MADACEWLPGMFCPVSELLPEVLPGGGFRTTTDMEWEAGLYPERRLDGTAEKVFCEAGRYDVWLYSG